MNFMNWFDLNGMEYIVSQSIYLIWCKIAAIEDLFYSRRQIDAKLLSLHSIQ